MEAWLLLTVYKKLPAPNPMAPLPISYDLPFSHNTSVTDGRQPHQKLDRYFSTIG